MLFGQKVDSSLIYAADTMPFKISKLKSSKCLESSRTKKKKKTTKRTKTLPKVSSGKQTPHTSNGGLLLFVRIKFRVHRHMPPEIICDICTAYIVFESVRQKPRKYRFGLQWVHKTNKHINTLQLGDDLHFALCWLCSRAETVFL